MMGTDSSTIIPLEDGHAILASFSIGPHSRGYQRWRREDSFRKEDLEDVLNESNFVLNVDWRELLEDAMDTILSQLNELGIEASVDLNEEDEHGVFAANGAEVRIKYSINDEDNFDQVIASINPVISRTAQYRKLRSSEGSDTWSYAILKIEDWRQLDLSVAGAVGLIFTDVRLASL